MNCKKCNEKLERGDNFCQKCGFETQEVEIYVCRLRKKGVLGTSSGYYDFLIRDGIFYILKLKYKSKSTLYVIIGLFLFNLIGGIIGEYFAEKEVKKSLKKIRSKWVTDSNRLFSEEYKDSIFLETSLVELKNDLIIKNKNIIFNINGDKYRFKLHKNNLKELKEFLKK